MAENIIDLDLKDRKILYELSLNARAPISAIGKKLKISKQVVKYRMDNLERKNVIQKYYAIINVNRLGYLYHRAFFKYSKILTEEEENEIIKFARNHLSIGWIALLEGEWDLALNAVVHNPIEYENVLREINAKFGNYFKTNYISIAVAIHHFKYKFLLNMPNSEDKILGGALGSPDIIDEIDYKILGILSKDGRISTLNLATKLKINASVVNYRIKKLIKKNIILGFNFQLNAQLLGYTHHKVLLYLYNMSNSSLKELVNYLKLNINIVYITESVGSANIEFETLTKTQNDFHNLMKDIRFNFSNAIRDFSTFILWFEEFNYLPMFKKYKAN